MRPAWVTCASSSPSDAAHHPFTGVRPAPYPPHVTGREPHSPAQDDLARVFVDLERLLDRIRRGELMATELEQARLRLALDALRDLRRLQPKAA